MPETNFGSDEPLYNIGVVSRMANVPENTLRAWERRYDFPQAARSAGGHRLYSQHEVMRLRWVKARVDEGMQISQAVRALRHLEGEGRFPEAPLSPPRTQISQTQSPSLEVFRQQILDSLLGHSTIVADQVLAQTMAIFDLETVILDIISPVMAAVGEAWERGEITVATEHFATHHLRHHLLMWMRTGLPAYNVSPAILTCGPGEWHEGSLLILGVLLRRLRWPIVYLGQSVPLSDLAAFISELSPSMIVFASMVEESAHALAEWPAYLPEVHEAGRPVVCFGGHVFTKQPKYIEQIPGQYLGDTIHEGVETLNRLLHDLHPMVR